MAIYDRQSIEAADTAVVAHPTRVLKGAIPEAVPVNLRRAAVQASEALRLRRSLVFGHTVAIELRPHALRFEPLRTSGPLEAPFEFTSRGSKVSGALRLKTPIDPLAAVVDEHVDGTLAATAWALALVAYAELTCVEEAVLSTAAPGRRMAPSRPNGSRSGSSGGRRTLSARAIGGALPLSRSLRPTLDTRSLLASYITGHRRQLSEGHRASAQAQRDAEVVGIVLREGETWVRPHARGVPSGATLRFVWDAPTAVQESMRVISR